MFFEKLKCYSGEENQPQGYVFHVGNRKLCLIGRGQGSDHSVIVIKFYVVRYYDAEGHIFLGANVEFSAVYDADAIGELENCFV
ncbi:hypothetical protein FRX31_008981 [Thalictrum thalictroides]|uniref:Uncharacterized protein n=1 Tax=Thalictrum thalictroides TaxID=46969 RepID=A0A7J6WZ89_THATH|nr:hypothetical protein FRX31_008981 [Thalictrum thalictroides]